MMIDNVRRRHTFSVICDYAHSISSIGFTDSNQSKSLRKQKVGFFFGIFVIKIYSHYLIAKYGKGRRVIWITSHRGSLLRKSRFLKNIFSVFFVIKLRSFGACEMRRMRSSIMCATVISSLVIITTISASRGTNERIDCYPERESKYSNYSKQACLARNCFYDADADDDVVQCYLSPNYGYVLEGPAQQLKNGLRLKLRRNSAVASMFEEPIDNVFLDIHYYTNDILRFKLYDADSQRYEVRRERE